jgi:hypothetical protein
MKGNNNIAVRLRHNLSRALNKKIHLAINGNFEEKNTM